MYRVATREKFRGAGEIERTWTSTSPCMGARTGQGQDRHSLNSTHILPRHLPSERAARQASGDGEVYKGNSDFRCFRNYTRSTCTHKTARARRGAARHEHENKTLQIRDTTDNEYQGTNQPINPPPPQSSPCIPSRRERDCGGKGGKGDERQRTTDASTRRARRAQDAASP